MILLAASSSDPKDLIQYGVLGIILMLVLFGYIWAKPSVDRIIEDKEKAEVQRDALIETYQTKIIPALTDASSIAVRAAGTLEETKPLLIEVRTLLRSIQGGQGEVR